MHHKSPEKSDLYDLEILLIVHPTGHWLDRIEAFRRFGLLGGEGLRVRRVLLCDTYELDPALHSPKAWPGIESVVVVNGPGDHPEPKIYHYYAHVLPAQGLQALWFLRVDDDSLTDIGRLVRHLDETFDWRDGLHLAGTINDDPQASYVEVIREIGGDRLLRGAGHCQFFHEWETSLTGYGAMQRILANGLAGEFLRRVAGIPRGFGDHCLTLAARLCGIPSSRVPSLTAQCHLEQFAVFSLGGDGFFHIHYLSLDNREIWARSMDKRRSLGLATDALPNQHSAIPTAATGASGNSEIVTDGEIGFLVQSSEEAVYRASQLAWDESLRHRLVLAARDWLHQTVANPGRYWQP